MLSDFINRESERNQIRKIYDNNNRKNLIIFISAKQGIGKSYFSKWFLATIHNKEKLEISINDNKQVLVDGSLLNLISQKIEKGIKKSFLIKLINNAVELTNIILAFFMPFAQRNAISKLSSVAKDKINNKIKDTTSLINIYLSCENRVICIENFQKIDPYSLDSLRKLISSNKNNVFLFEYTIDKNSSKTYQSTLDVFRQSCNTVEEIFLDKFSDIDIELIVKNSCNHTFDLKSACKYYNNNDGNMFDFKLALKFKDKSIRINSSINNNKNYTTQVINELSSNDKITLSIISLHEFGISIKTLFNVLKHDYIYYKHDNLSKMVESDLIVINNDRISIKHDSINTILSSSSLFKRFREAAYKIVLKYYENQIILSKKYNMNYEKYYTLLIPIIAVKDPMYLIKYISELEEYIVKNYSIESSRIFLSGIFNNIDLDNTGIVNKIIDLFVKSRNYDFVYNFLKRKFEKDLYQKVVFAFLLAHYKEQSLNNFIKENLISIESNSREYFLLKLIELYGYSRSEKYIERDSLYNKLIENNNFKHYVEYGFVLRYTSQIDVIYSHSLNKVKESIGFFSNKQHIDESEDSRITYAMQLSRNGDLVSAEKELLKLINYYKENRFVLFKVFNNYSILRIYQGKLNYDTIDMLKFAYNTCNDIFSETLILSNMFSYYNLESNFDKAKDLIYKLINLTNKLSNNQIAKIVYYNLSIYYNNINNTKKCKYFKLKSTQILPLENEKNYWNKRYGVNDFKDNNFKQYLSCDFHLCYLSSWTITLPFDYLTSI